MLMLAVLIGLGVWQLQRLQWKRGILAAIDRAEASPAIPLPDHPVQFTKVRTTGRFIAGIPLGRLSEPKDIANAALYLASDEAEFVTGVVLEVDGGRTI